MNSGTSEAGSILFIFDRSPEGQVLIRTDGGRLPSSDDLEIFADTIEEYGAVEKSARPDMWGKFKNMPAPAGMSFISRRELPWICGFEIFRRSGTAYQMMNLSLKNKFCGECGEQMRNHEQDRARLCPSCGNTVYPALSNAVIVVVEKEGRLLLGHNVNFPSGRYSILAGFVEPGETLEETIRREIFEESGITVKNIRYFGSQPWPFPNSMMLGFNADWESGEPKADGGELSEVRWFAPYELPDLPPSISISRKLIDDWLSRISGEK